MSVSPKATSVWLWITSELYLSRAVTTTPMAVHSGSRKPDTNFKGIALPLLRQEQRDDRLILTRRLSTHRAGPGGVWTPGRPVKPSDRPQQVAGISSLSRLIRGWSKKTEEVDSRNLIFQPLKDGASGGGREIPSCLFKVASFLEQSSARLPSTSWPARTHLGSKEALDIYCGWASSHESIKLDRHNHACIRVPFTAGDPPPVSQKPLTYWVTPQHHPLGDHRQRASQARILEGKQVKLRSSGLRRVGLLQHDSVLPKGNI